jgi:hypothetical protein
LSLRQSRFRGAILDIAPTMLNRPKESLDSEDVRIYKRNRLAAYAVVVVGLLLAIGATLFESSAKSVATWWTTNTTGTTNVRTEAPCTSSHENGLVPTMKP